MAWLEGDLSSAYSHINIVLFVAVAAAAVVGAVAVVAAVAVASDFHLAPLAATVAPAAAPVPVTLPSASSKRRDVGLVQLRGGLQ